MNHHVLTDGTISVIILFPQKYMQSGMASYPHCVRHPLLPGQLKSERGGNSSVSRLLSLGWNQEWRKKTRYPDKFICFSFLWMRQKRLQSFSCAYLLIIVCFYHTSFIVTVVSWLVDIMAVQMEKTWPDLEVFISA